MKIIVSYNVEWLSKKKDPTITIEALDDRIMRAMDKEFYHTGQGSDLRPEQGVREFFFDTENTQ